MFPEDQISELKKLSPDVMLAEEGGIEYLLIPKLAMPPNCDPAIVDVILCPVQRDGYPSRLFFAQKVKSPKTLNWNGQDVRILDKTWHAYSWKVIRPGLRLAQMVSAHLAALR
ncbi:MAG: hypothetical protein PHD29_05940 [bacterium]|nr:hypothetical protein [bacterium]